MSDERSAYAVLLSGGKDSNYALYLRMKELGAMPCCAVTVKAGENDMLFHAENSAWAGLQCRAMGIPWIYAESLEEGLARARARGASEIVTGGILSNYQRREFGEAASRAGLRAVNPLWGVDQEEYMRSLVREGFRYIMVKVAALGLDRRWLGREMDERATEELIALSRKYRFNASLEGGEGETFVLSAPHYRGEIRVVEAESIWKGDYGVYLIKRAELV